MLERLDRIVYSVDRTPKSSKILDVSGWIAIVGGIALSILLGLKELL